MKENANQRNFRLSMNDLMATPVGKKHVFEVKNFYKDYPCECGAINNNKGSTCWRYKASLIRDEYYPVISNPLPAPKGE